MSPDVPTRCPPPAESLRRAIAAARAAGLDPSGARVVRRGSAVIVDLPAADRIARVEGDPAAAARQSALGRAFARRAAPVMRLWSPPPAAADPRITFWQRLQPGPTLDSSALGRLTAAVHARCPAAALPADLPPLDPFVEIDHWRARLPDWIPPADRAALAAQTDAARAAWPETRGGCPLGEVLLHGDVHRGNVMWADGAPRFIDIEFGGLGPAAWDLVPAAVGVRRYGADPAGYRAFAAAYGADPDRWSPTAPAWAPFETLCRAYELLCAAWTLGTAAIDARREAEARLRLDGLLRGGSGIWTLS